EVPLEFELFQNYPNPFNPTTIIDYTIARESFVQLRIYDLLGREIKTLVDQRIPAGKHTVQFEANELQSGVYVYRFNAAGFVESKKMILAK
ncbi:MAG: T9SS type A sorting domain-containing protein, partial [bacterium]